MIRYALALLILTVFPVLAFGQTLTATDGAATILPSAVDTTSSVPVDRYAGVGFLMTWAEEDSASVVVQISLDSGTTWAQFLSTGTLDRDTVGLVKRALALDPMDGAGDIAATLPLGGIARAIITNAGSDTMSSVVSAWVYGAR